MNQFNLGQFINKFVDYSRLGLRGNPAAPSNQQAPSNPATSENFNAPGNQPNYDNPANPSNTGGQQNPGSPQTPGNSQMPGSQQAPSNQQAPGNSGSPGNNASAGNYTASGNPLNSGESMLNSQSGTHNVNSNQIIPQRYMPKPAVFINTMAIHTMPLRSLNMMHMNHLESLDRALYVKDLMNLPKDLGEFLEIIQQQVVQTKDAQAILKNIKLSQVAELLQQNGKDAVNKLIMTMSNASKQGITDFSQIKDAIKLINASVATAGQNDPAQTLKSLMLLYLPWLPLQDGVGFELEIEASEDESGESESSITIMISTKNYGNIKVTLFLEGGYSVAILVNCSSKFPKEDLLKRIKSESISHSIPSSVVFEEKQMIQNEDAPCQAKINLSNPKDVNPFLLLMANAVIRHTIEIDNEAR